MTLSLGFTQPDGEHPCRILIFGAGNLLLSDEGFGVHFIRYLEAHFRLPGNVELLEAGTMGLLLASRIEEADRLYIVDAIDAPGQPGDILRYEKKDFMLQRLLLKLSPHQVSVQEMLLVSELRGRCPQHISLLGVIPSSLLPGDELSPLLRRRLPQLADQLFTELEQLPSGCRGLNSRLTCG